MGRSPGQHKTGGRQKGTPNKNSKRIHALLEDLDFSPLCHLVEILSTLTPDTQAKVCMQLMEYTFPKRKSVDHLTQKEDYVREHGREDPLSELSAF